MKKDKKIKELDEWLENSKDEDFENHDVSTLNEYDHEIFDLVEFAIKKNIDISFIEEMPLGDTAFSRKSTFTSNDEILKKIKLLFLSQQYSLEQLKKFVYPFLKNIQG